jgi:putative MFS transporter
MVYAAEEYPASRRGMVIGVIGAFSALGSIACAGLAPLLLATSWGWRTVYFVGIVPLVLLAFARRSLAESKRFAQTVKEPGAARRFTHVFSTPYRTRVLQLALIWALTYVCFSTAVTFWKEFAVKERAFTDAQVGTSIMIAAALAMPLVFLTGSALDRIGRRWGAVAIYLAGSVGVVVCYRAHAQWALTAGLIFGIAAASAVLAVLNTFTTELFPTELRADAYAWSNNLLGRIGYVIAPYVTSLAAEEVGWGVAVPVTAVFPIVALALVLWQLPETKAKELEETAAIGH